MSGRIQQSKEPKLEDKMLTEVAWEVCNQVGGIYTVIRSKAPVMVDKWKDNYLLLGPKINSNVSSDFEPDPYSNSPIAQVARELREMGWDVEFGTWLVSGRPQTVLLNPHSVMHELGNIKYYYWQNHHIEFSHHDSLIDEVMAFGYMVHEFLSRFARVCLEQGVELLAHFHEWMAGTAIPDIRREQIPIKTIFTTHATLLGRYLAMNDPYFYDHLPYLNWETEARNFNVDTIARLERACAHGANVLTTVSEVTAKECVHLLGRSPEAILPNGLNIDRFSVVHEVQNLHHRYKEQINHFVMGHFFQSYSFDLDNVIYFFTSGRFEFKNKGYDLTLEALARLNHKMKEQNVNKTVVMFFVTKQPFHSINQEVMTSRAVMEEIDHNCESIMQQLKRRLFEAAAVNSDHRLPILNELVDDYWKLRYRRTIQSWKSDRLPSVVTHNLINDGNDQVLSYLRSANLLNYESDKVKIVYHPDFISSTSPLFGMDYGQFVRGCHMGIFPSYYEPWGYTPVECLARGVSAVTSDLSGFGDYVKGLPMGDEEHGLYMIERANQDYDTAAEQLSEKMLTFVMSSSRKRIETRNKAEDLSEAFDWVNLIKHYEHAYDLACEKFPIEN
ncbi:glycogen(starch) synthase [Reichenbachiella agariperforans]|uniref:Glycogen(Starch) synthase n=1 Tax=Reichenbachiella agariperforans TaxID=156994 RepID=A0A1M6WU67_REIAG|nr:glycosyltransferase [Reichenbachiella agariperforans]SHK97287.1 glycogen(starch) synthase [Reichenbachiella agariperforans]